MSYHFLKKKESKNGREDVVIDHDCLQCEDTGFIVSERDGIRYARPCSCLAQASYTESKDKQREKIRRLGIPVPKEMNREQKEMDKKISYAKDKDHKRGVWLYGSTGTGKTSYVSYKILSNPDFTRTLIFNGKYFDRVLRRVSLDGKYTAKEIEPKRYHVIFIDDVDKSKMSPALKK